MKAVILAAGYGTRLQRDVAADSSGMFGHLAGVAKPLLPVGPCALISYWARALNASGSVDRVYVVTNALYVAAFEEWAAHFTNVQVLSDQTRSNDERLGAVACLQLAVKHFKIEDHVVVIGGDTLFREDFSLSKVNESFSDLQTKCEDSCLLLSYQCKEEGEFCMFGQTHPTVSRPLSSITAKPTDTLTNNGICCWRVSPGFASCSQVAVYRVSTETHKYGILEVDGNLRVVCMKEKPLPTETKSRRACPCFYVFSKKSLPLLDDFLEEKREAPIEEKDAPGNFVSWLIPRKPVYIHQISGRFDVGNLSSYAECDLYFREKLQDVTSYMV